MDKITYEEFKENYTDGIEFLREYDDILKLIYQRCKRTDDLQSYATSGNGGFRWSGSVEGFYFWRDIFDNNKVEVFYEKYPKPDLNKVD